MSDKKASQSVLAATHQELIDQLVAGYQKPADIIGENGLLKQLTKTVFEAALRAEMAVHLGYDKHAPVGNALGNVRNGQSVKTATGEFGDVDVTAATDRNQYVDRERT